MFSTDRGNKYGWGSLRLVTLTALCLFHFDRNLLLVGTKFRWLSFILLGGIGAIVNVNIISPTGNILLLLVCGAAIMLDLQFDATMAIYLSKTLCGDYIAGKLDTLEWKISGIFAVVVATSCAILSETVIKEYGRITLLLFVMQVFCEYGDNHFERFKFFRHRYSFELIHTLILFTLPGMTNTELRVILMDLIACSAYRSSNYTIIVLRKLIASDFLVTAPRMILYHIRGYLQGFQVQYVRDPDVAVAVMKQSDCKGYVLERVLSCPAWAPIISLESIDGKLWEDMRKDFTNLLKNLPGPEKLKKIAKKHLDILLAGSIVSDDIIDANCVAEITMKVFIEFLFEREWDSKFDILVKASFEWRKEIAAKGEGNAEVKRQAIEMTISLLRESSLWNLHGENWTLPRYYSLLLQPFLISPTINTGDIIVAFNRYPELEITEAIREMHPFPILERWMSKDIVVERHNNTPSLSTSAVTTTSKALKSPQNNTMSKCPYMNLNSTNEDSVGSMIDDDDNDNNGDDDDDDSSRADMSMKNIHSMHMHKEGCTSPKNTQITPTATTTSSPRTSTYTSTAARPFVIQKNTQIVMFPSDWKHDQSWSVFGAGKRACPGAHFAMPWLTLFRDCILLIKENEKKHMTKMNIASKFQPEKNHFHSGRHNDDIINLKEIYYFVTNIIPKVLFTPKLGDGEECM